MWHTFVYLLVLCSEDPQATPQAPPEAWQALKDVALALEIVGPHENWATDFGSELRYVRRHYRLLQHAPALAEACWLPAPGVARELCCFNEGYQGWLQMQRIIYPHRGEQIDVVLMETRQLYTVWDCARRAASPNESWALRRRMLQRLRDSIGDQAYNHGRLPCWVPHWYFQESVAIAN